MYFNKQDEKDEKVNQADVYEHITEDVVHADAQTIDAATAQQQNQQKINNKLEDEDESNASDTDMQVEEKEEVGIDCSVLSKNLIYQLKDYKGRKLNVKN